MHNAGLFVISKFRKVTEDASGGLSGRGDVGIAPGSPKVGPSHGRVADGAPVFALFRTNDMNTVLPPCKPFVNEALADEFHQTLFDTVCKRLL